MEPAPAAKHTVKRVRTGCFTCRKRHVKCDERRPQCRHCEVAQRTCEFPSFYTPGKEPSEVEATIYQFPEDHVWLPAPPEYKFVYVFETSPGSVDTPQEPNKAKVQIESVNLVEKQLERPLPRSNGSCLPIDALLTSPAASQECGLDAHPKTSPTAVSHTTPYTPGTEVAFSFPLTSPSAASIYTTTPQEPLSDPVIAKILRHYLDNLVGWLELNDPQKHFAIAVPHIALRTPMLFDAILAFSASHLSLIDSSYSAELAIEYHDACVRHLIPALQDHSLAREDSLPVTTVILRMYEMFRSEVDPQNHLRGCSSLFVYNRNTFRSRSIKHTAFWTYVRQEIHTGLQNTSITNIDTSDKTYHVVWTRDTEDEWTNQITWLMAKVVNHCYDKDQKTKSDIWDELRSALDLWKQRLPDIFKPLYVLRDDGPIAISSHLYTWHAIAAQYYHISNVLLALYNPHQITGMDWLYHARLIEAEITHHTTNLIASVRGLLHEPDQPRHHGCLINAIPGLVVCGKTLRKEDEQAVLLGVLKRIEDKTAWPMGQGIRALEVEWEKRRSR